MPTGLQPVPFGHSGTDPGTGNPTGCLATVGNRSPSQQPLHHHDVEPTPELPADLPFGADHLEPDGSMKRDRGLVTADDAGQDRMEAVLSGPLDELLEQGTAYSRAALVAPHVHRVLDAGRVGGPVAERGERRETDDLLTV